MLHNVGHFFYLRSVMPDQVRDDKSRYLILFYLRSSSYLWNSPSAAAPSKGRVNKAAKEMSQIVVAVVI